MLRLLTVLIAVPLLTLNARAEQPQFQDRIGDIYELRLVSVSETSGGGSSGSSRHMTTLTERVIALHEDGVELVFDLPEHTSAEDRARAWQFPARVLQAPGRPLQLLNEPELEVRVRAWLLSGGMTEAACGRWVFTWTSIKIECDPQSVLRVLESFDLRLNPVRAGTRVGASEGATFAIEDQIDPEAVRRGRAETDVAVAEMTGEPPITFEAALQAHASERISGTQVTTIEMDSAGYVGRRTRVTRVEATDVHGSSARESTTETVQRRLVSRGPS